MDGQNKPKAIAAGVVGFLLYLVAQILAQVAAVRSLGLVGAVSMSFVDQVIVYGIVPALMATGGVTAAWLLGATVRRSLFLGLLAAAVAYWLEWQHDNYAPFDRLETLAFVVGAAICVLGTAAPGGSWPGRSLVAAGVAAAGLLALAWFGLGSGLVVAFSAWVVLPVVLLLFAQPPFLDD